MVEITQIFIDIVTLTFLMLAWRSSCSGPLVKMGVLMKFRFLPPHLKVYGNLLLVKVALATTFLPIMLIHLLLKAAFTTTINPKEFMS